MTKAQLKQLQYGVNILDAESNNPSYDETEIIVFENAVSSLLNAIRHASLEISHELSRSRWQAFKLSLKWKYAIFFK
jgi:hypothetical protein